MMKPIRMPHEYTCFRPGHRDEQCTTARDMVSELDISAYAKILDVGAGNGRDLNWIHDRRPFTTCIGVDKNWPGWVCADATQLPFFDKTFDIAYANSVFCEMTEDEAKSCLAEMKRVAHRVYYSEIYEDGSSTVHRG